MDFKFTDEQQMLRDGLRRYLEDRYPFELRTAASRSETGLPKGMWQAFADELVILGAGFPEDRGGTGGGPVEHMIIMEELGRALALEPYLETIVIGAGILARSDSRLARETLESVLRGELILAFAWAEQGMAVDFTGISTRATREEKGWRLTGCKTLVTAAPWASHLILAARTSGTAGDASGISLFLVDKAQVGITTCEFKTIDGRRACDITFDNVLIPGDTLLGQDGSALSLLEETADRAVAAMCAEAVGIMSRLLDLTMEYTKQRSQFGKALASFQVLQHRMADMLMELELATSAVYLATLKLGARADERAKAASAAKATICTAGRFVGQNAIQLHGAMGMTDELAVGHYFKRLMAISSEFGGEDFHRGRFAKLTLALCDGSD